MMELSSYTVNELEPIYSALRRIEDNHEGIVVITSDGGVVLGLLSDGDIRRHLLKGGSIDDAVNVCTNTDFVFGDITTPRELLLKQLDRRIKIIPILDRNKTLRGIVSRDQIPTQSEGAVYSRAVAPVRISFGGGGSDLTHYFKDDFSGAVINSCISIYSHATLRLREDKKAVIHSLDLRKSIVCDDLEYSSIKDQEFGLIVSLIRSIGPSFGFELYLNSDFAIGSGLGGSSAVAAVLLGCFNEFRQDKWTRYELAEIAYQAERHYLGVPGGWQDQYAAVFGGVNFMEFNMSQNLVHPLRIDPVSLAELEACLILCDTGMTHDSGRVHRDQEQNLSARHIRSLVNENVKLCYQMRDHILRGRLYEFGCCMDEGWQLKRQFSEKISSPLIDSIYEDAKLNGAIGGKLLGAGGGGFFLFFSLPHMKYSLVRHLEEKGLSVKPFRFEFEGLKTWKARENKHFFEELQ